MSAWITAALVAVPAALVLLYLRGRARYYRELFSPEHLRELHAGFVEIIERSPASDQPLALPASADGHPPGTLITSRGLVLVVTHRRVDEGSVLHISISQEGGPTTQAVASRVAYLLLMTLARNPAELSPFFTPSRIFHLVLVHRQEALALRPFDEVLADYQRGYQPVPFAARQLPGAGAEPAAS